LLPQKQGASGGWRLSKFNCMIYIDICFKIIKELEKEVKELRKVKQIPHSFSKKLILCFFHK
jgi:hypothetical protein